MLPASRVLPIGNPVVTGPVTGGLTLISGWSFEETSGIAPAKLRLYDGSGVNGARIVTISLLANESTRDNFPEPMLGVFTGVFCELVGGTIDGSLWTLQATLDDNGFAFAEGARPVCAGEV
jgi:hypothetical protein